jgi:hypothetical protein
MRAIIPILLLANIAMAADPTVDWLMQQATTAPTSQPSTQPTAVFHSDDPPVGRQGTIELSDGRTIHGHIETTAEKPVRVWIEKTKEYQDIPFEMIQSIEATVLWEKDEPEWRFKASGSDVKEYTGKTYPARETTYKFTLTNGDIAEGSVVAPLYVSNETFVLHKRDKGDAGTSLKELVYVKSVRFK